MKKIIYPFLIFLFTLISRFWKLGEIPVLLEKEDLFLRYFSAVLGIFLPFAVFVIALKIFRRKKPALISALIFAFLPQSIIEGRIVSVIFYPPFWEGNLPSFQRPSDFWSDILDVFSFKMLFFENVSFYWGGIRETGLMYLSLMPFFIAGLFRFLAEKKFPVPALLALVLTAVSQSPNFPENRFIFLALPFLTIISVKGLLFLWQGARAARLSAAGLLLFLFYELILFFHFYTVHYPRQVADFAGNIIRPF